MDFLDAGSISAGEFSAKYAAAARPCMVRGCTAKWRAADRWKSAQVSHSLHPRSGVGLGACCVGACCGGSRGDCVPWWARVHLGNAVPACRTLQSGTAM